MENKSTILVVDDNPDIHQAIQALLDNQDYDLRFVESGAEALEKAVKIMPDLILLDVMMPDMDGFEVCRRLRSDPVMAEVPIIMVSILDDRDSVLKGIESGADDFMTKPFDRLILQARVRTITRLNRYRRMRESEEKFRNLVETSSDWIWELNRDRIYTYVSPNVENILGYKQEEIIGKTPFDLMLPAERKRIARIIEDTNSTYPPMARLENICLHKDGHTVVIESNGVPIISPNGKFMGYRGVNRDITERRKMEGQLEDSLEKVTRSRNEINALLTASQVVLKDQEFASTARAIFDECKKLIGANSGYVALLSENKSENKILFLDPGDRECTVDPNTPMPIRGLRARSYQANKAVYDNNFMNSEEAKYFPEGHMELSNVMFAPLTVSGQAVGIMGLSNKPGGFTENDARLAPAFGELTAVALRNNMTLETLQMERNKTQEYLDVAGVIIVVLNPDQTIALMNKKGCEILGCKEGEIIGKNWFDNFIPKRINSEVKVVFDKLMAGEMEPVEYYENEVVTASGTERIISWHNALLKDEKGKIIASLSSGTDITERIHYENQLQESEERYRTLFESTRDAIIMTTPDGRIISANTATVKILGYDDLEELLEIPVANLYYDSEQREIVLSELLERGYIDDFELIFVKKDGTPVYLLASAILRRDEDGNILRLEGFFKDVTERREAEEELRNTNIRLEQTLEELRTTQQQIIQQERLRALGQLASGIAHDFNNALMPIVGYTELLLSMPHIMKDSQRLESYLKLMGTAADDARSIVKRLSEFYRSREEAEEIMPIDFNELVREAIQLTQPRWRDQAQANSLTIDVETDLQNVPIINGSSAELREVLTNLIINAVDAMSANGAITILTRSHRDGLVLEVADTGAGMTAETRRRCLEPFFSTKGDMGTGLGLSMVHGIISRHEGTVNIDSELGRGTTFSIYLPQGKRNQTQIYAEPEIAHHSFHVLVVDDQSISRDTVAEYLKADGHTSETANNGRDGLAMFRERKFDLVVTDRAMPDMSGTQLAFLIKQLSPEVPIIMLTGFGDIMKASDERPEGVDYIVSKPITLANFREALANV